MSEKTTKKDRDYILELITRIVRECPHRQPTSKDERRYDAMGLICIDPKLGAPRHYHWPTDTPENLDLDQLMLSVDFTEELVRGIFRHRLG